MKTTAFAIVLGLGSIGVAMASQFHEPPSARSLQNQTTTVEAPAEAPRIITIRPDTRWVNVHRLETVRFVIEGSHDEPGFVRRIDGSANSFPLKEIAPSGVSGVELVRVYVAPDRVTRR